MDKIFHTPPIYSLFWFFFVLTRSWSDPVSNCHPSNFRRYIFFTLYNKHVELTKKNTSSIFSILIHSRFSFLNFKQKDVADLEGLLSPHHVAVPSEEELYSNLEKELAALDETPTQSPAQPEYPKEPAEPDAHPQKVNF